MPAEHFAHLHHVLQKASDLDVKLILTTVSIGCSNGFLSLDPHPIEALPVRNALLVALSYDARIIPAPPVTLEDRTFENMRGDRMGWNFHELSSKLSLAELYLARASLHTRRPTRTNARPGNIRDMKYVRVLPFRHNRLSTWHKMRKFDATVFLGLLTTTKSEHLLPDSDLRVKHSRLDTIPHNVQ